MSPEDYDFITPAVTAFVDNLSMNRFHPYMKIPLELLPSALSDLFAQVMVTGKLTIADRYGLLAALLDEAVSKDDLHNIDRLLRSIRRGRVTVVEEISNISRLANPSACWKADRHHTARQKSSAGARGSAV